MAIEGPLKELDLHAVFQLLDLGRKTGVLRITSNLRDNEGRVFFDRGAVCGAVIRSDPQPLGTALLRAGRVSETELARARTLQQAGDARRIGDILVDAGAIGRRELDRQVRAHIERVIFDLVGWSEGYFLFEEAPIAPGELEAPVRIPTEAILMEAARRSDEWSRIETRITHLGLVPRLVLSDGDGPEDGPGGGASGGMLDLAPTEWEVLAAVDGARDIRSLAEAMERPELDVARTLFGLASTGVIVLDDPSQPRHEPDFMPPEALAERVEDHLALGDLESACTVAETLVAADPGRAAPHVLLGRALHAAGAYAEAIGAFEEALRREPSHARARRLLGVSQVALGRFEAALHSWSLWVALAGRPRDEEALAPVVDRLSDAATILSQAVRDRHA